MHFRILIWAPKINFWWKLHHVPCWLHHTLCQLHLVTCWPKHALWAVLLHHIPFGCTARHFSCTARHFSCTSNHFSCTTHHFGHTAHRFGHTARCFSRTILFRLHCSPFDCTTPYELHQACQLQCITLSTPCAMAATPHRGTLSVKMHLQTPSHKF